MSDSQKKTIETYQRLMNANATVQAFLLARKLGVFDKLSEGQQTSIELAEALNLSVRPLELLLDMLCGTGYIEKYTDDYALSVLGKMLPSEWSDLGCRYWSELEGFIRDGSRIASPDDPLETTEFGVEARAFEWMGTPAAMELLEILNIGKSRPGLRVTELACGSAVFSSAMAYHSPDMKVCLVDSAENLARAKETTESIEVSDRCQFVEADPTLFEAKFKNDLIVIANRISHFDDDAIRALLGNAKKQLNKKGEIVIVDDFCEKGESLFANHIKALETELRTPRSIWRTKRTVTDLLKECGFVDVMYSDLRSPPGTKGVLVAGVSSV